jgi:hypothetical protein
MDPHLPKFISDYPTGKVDMLGRNLRHLSRDASEYLPPLRPVDTAGVAAIIMPISRNSTEIHKVLAINMQLAEEFGLYLIALCSHGCSRQDIAHFAQEYPQLRWAAIDGPFVNSSMADLATDGLLFTFPSDNDLSAKRNFGLQLGRTMGWGAVIFADDDRVLTKTHLLRLFSLRRNGAALVMSNSRAYPDNSVVASAYRQAYGNEHMDSFMDSSASVIGLKDNWFAFYPQIYNEDWLFMLPYILQRCDVAWAGSVRQGKYNPFVEKRATREEAGDLIAEGLMRLAMGLINEPPSDSKRDLLHELVELADKNFWEREILQRTIFIREMQNKIRRGWPSLRKRRIHATLRVSLKILIGDEDQAGLDPAQIAEWVQAWKHDLEKWRNLPVPQVTGAKARIGDALRLMAAADRAIWQDTQQTARSHAQILATNTVSPEPSKPIPLPATALQAHPQAAIGLESTWHLAHYLNKNKQSIQELVKIWRKLRYDLPIRSLDGNKPVATIAIVTRAYEDPDSISQSIKNIAAWNTQRAPIHCIIWIIPDATHHRQLKLYREYLMARLMLETTGTNIRLLSCVGGRNTSDNFQKLADELISTTAKLYWKTAIDSVDHPVYITNSQNEVLSHGDLSDLLGQEYKTPRTSLKQELAGLASSPASPTIDTPEYRRATELARSRLLRQSASLRQHWRPQLPTGRLRWAMKRAKITLFELDQLHYSTQVHDQLGLNAFAKASRAACVVLRAGTGMRTAKSAIEQVFAKMGTTNNPDQNLSEIMVIISGRQSVKKLEAYRAEVISKVLSDTTVPTGAFIASSIVPNSNNSTIDQFNTCEALIRYEHWLENHTTMPRILWSVPSLRRRPTITRRPRLSSIPMSLVARARTD